MTQFGESYWPWDVEQRALDMNAAQLQTSTDNYTERSLLIWAGAGILGYAIYKYMTRRTRK